LVHLAGAFLAFVQMWICSILRKVVVPLFLCQNLCV
jgi:hypothetical protein